MLYVHLDNTGKWIDSVSTEQKVGYQAKPGLLDSQIIALINFPTKCWVDDNGAVVTPDNLPLSDAEKQAQEASLTITKLQQQVSDLSSQVNQANSDKESLQSQIASLMLEISKLQTPTQTTSTTGGAK